MITNEELLKIAALSKLTIPQSELSSLAKDLSDIVAFADSISELETKEDDEISGFSLDSLRADIAAPSLPPDQILKNAAESENGFFIAEVRRHG